MKFQFIKFFALLLFTAMFISISAVAQNKSLANLTNEEYSRVLLNKYRAITASSLPNTLNKPSRAKNNLTMLMLEVKRNWNKLTDEAKTIFSVRASRPVGLTATYLETTKNFFKFYYATTGADAVSLVDANANGVPDYVENVASAFIKSSSFYDSLGYNRPPLAASDNGKYCVYISNSEAGDAIYGYSQPESDIGDNPLTSVVETGSLTSFMVMRNDYVGFGSTDAELQIAMEVTAAHEYFHAIQFGYEYNKMEGYLMEMCSTWAEDQVFPGDDDNWQYLSDIFDTPDISLDWDEYLDGDAVNYSSAYSMHWYAAWIFMRYLTDHYGAEVPKFIFENNIRNTTSTAIDNVLKIHGTTYTAALKDYNIALAILTQSANPPMNAYSFARGDDYRTVTKNSGGSPTGPFHIKYEKILNYSGTKVTYSSTVSGNKRLMRAGADFIKILPSANFSVSVTSRTANPNFTIRLIKSDSYTNPTLLSVAEPTVAGNTHTINVSDKNSYSSYVLVIYNAKYSTAASRDTTSIQYDISVNAPLLTDGVRITSPIGGEIWQIGEVQNITWESANVTNVMLECSTDSGASWDTITTTLAATGSYAWSVAGNVSSLCKVRISDTANSASNSVSANTFSIVPKGTKITILTEDLSKVVSGSIGAPGATDLASTLDAYTAVPGWTGAKIYAAGGAVKVGSSALGYLVTPALNLTGNDGSGTFKFDMQTFGTDTKVVQVMFSTDNGVSYTQLGSDIVPTSSMVSQSINFSGGTVSSKFKITGKAAGSNRFYVDNISVISGGVTSLEHFSEASSVPKEFALAQNYPNPFNPSTTISFMLSERADVQLNIFNQLGEKVAALVNGEFEAGSHAIVWNAAKQPSGIYFYQIRVGNFSETKKLQLLK